MQTLKEALIGKKNADNALSANKIIGILNKKAKKVPVFDISFIENEESSIGPRYEFLAEVKNKEKQEPAVIGAFAHDTVLVLLDVFNEMGFFPSKEHVHINTRLNVNKMASYNWNSDDKVRCDDIAESTEDLITGMFTDRRWRDTILEAFRFNIYVSKLSDKVCYITIESYISKK